MIFCVETLSSYLAKDGKIVNKVDRGFNGLHMWNSSLPAVIWGRKIEVGNSYSMVTTIMVATSQGLKPLKKRETFRLDKVVLCKNMFCLLNYSTKI